MLIPNVVKYGVAADRLKCPPRFGYVYKREKSETTQGWFCNSCGGQYSWELSDDKYQRSRNPGIWVIDGKHFEECNTEKDQIKHITNEYGTITICIRKKF